MFFLGFIHSEGYFRKALFWGEKISDSVCTEGWKGKKKCIFKSNWQAYSNALYSGDTDT